MLYFKVYTYKTSNQRDAFSVHRQGLKRHAGNQCLPPPAILLSYHSSLSARFLFQEQINSIKLAYVTEQCLPNPAESMEKLYPDYWEDITMQVLLLTTCFLAWMMTESSSELG